MMKSKFVGAKCCKKGFRLHPTASMQTFIFCSSPSRSVIAQAMFLNATLEQFFDGTVMFLY